MPANAGQDTLATMARPPVHLVATGGTIAMTGTPARPALSGTELVQGVPELDSVAELTVERIGSVPAGSLAPALAARAIAAASAAVQGGAVGAVLTQGTDT